MFCTLKKKKIYPAYVSKHNSKREKHVILLNISDGGTCEAKSEGRRQWHYLSVKKLSVLLRGITSKHYVDFYCLNCIAFILLQQKTNLNLIKTYVKTKFFVM